MKRNIGETDSIVRLFAGLALVIMTVVLIKVLPFAVIIAAYAVTLVLAATGIVGNCPLYTLFHINTRNEKMA
jgi:Protein of unknown function (DUF2892)